MGLDAFDNVGTIDAEIRNRVERHQRGCGDAMLHSSRMFGLLRYDGKANGKEPERQKERTLEHAELKTKSQQTPVKFLRKSKPLTMLSC